MKEELTSLLRKCLREVAAYTPGKPIEEVKRELGIPSAIKLASNENPLGPSPKALEAVQRVLSELHRYPDAHCFYLRQRLSQHLGISPEEIIVGNGSDEIITIATRAFLDSEDEVVIAQPTFLIYRIAAQIAGVKIRQVPLRSFRYDLSAMRRAVNQRTKIVFIANPDNPTGTYVTKEEVEMFLQDLPSRTIVFFDEAYAELVDAPDYPKTIPYLSKHPAIITRTFSKAYGLAGLRVGYGVAPVQLVEAMHRVREPFNVNSIAQAGAMAALDDTEHLERTRCLLRQEKSLLYQTFQELGLEAIPSATNFILFKVGPKARELAQTLLRRGIIVREMQAWDLPHYIRVTIGLHEENRAFIQILKEEIRRHR